MTPAPVSDRLARIARLARKELSEILRDRRTILTLVLMPLLLYPLLSVAFKQFFLASGIDANQQPEYKVAFLSEADGDLFYKYLMFGDELLRRTAPPSAKPVTPPKVIPLVLDIATHEKLKESIITGTAHVGIVVKGQIQEGRDSAIDYEALFLADSPTSRDVLKWVERRIARVNTHFLETRVGKPGPPVARLLMSPEALTRPDGGEIVSLSALVPLILILMTITGAVYPAIDLTAGERERGTLEILVAAPVPRMGLLFAKYVSVVTVAVLTALVNLVMMMVTLTISGLGGLVFGGGLTVLLVVQLFGLLLLFATFFSAVLLTISSFARSFKEAQAYLIPLMLVSLAPGLVGMIPGLKLNSLFSVVPLVNIVLLGRDLFEGDASPALAVIVVLSTLAYATAALAVAARIFGSEGVLYNEQSGWADLFQKPREVQPYPTIATAMLCYALGLPSLIIIHELFASRDMLLVLGPGGLLLTQTIGAIVIFGGIPLIAAIARNITIRTGFQCDVPSIWSLLGAGVLGLALFFPVFAILDLMQRHGLTLLSGQESRMGDMVKQWRELSPSFVAGCLVMTALVEEWFFRGFLFSALRSVSSPTVAILTCGALFGFLHAVFLFDRLLTSTLLGIILSWVAYQSGSVLPGMLLHGGYNALWGLLAYFQADSLQPEIWWPASIVGLGAGALVVWFGRRSNSA